MIVNHKNSNSYSWGNKCKAWELLISDNAIVKEELMPPHTEEQLHFHKKTDQFFYILEGEATFLVDEMKLLVSKHEGLPIKKGQTHKIMNNSNAALRFLVISFPGNQGDRINL